MRVEYKKKNRGNVVKKNSPNTQKNWNAANWFVWAWKREATGYVIIGIKGGKWRSRRGIMIGSSVRISVRQIEGSLTFLHKGRPHSGRRRPLPNGEKSAVGGRGALGAGPGASFNDPEPGGRRGVPGLRGQRRSSLPPPPTQENFCPGQDGLLGATSEGSEFVGSPLHKNIPLDHKNGMFGGREYFGGQDDMLAMKGR